MSRHFRIHPALGVARMGNAPDAFFIGPEQPGRPANWGLDRFESFRDPKGRIKRQAARFRVFEYTEDAGGRITNPREVSVGGDIQSIEWRVHLANTKSSFFSFNGQSGAKDVYRKRAAKPTTAPETDTRRNRRNASVKRRERLEIDPGEQLISTAAPKRVVLKNPNANIPFIKDLGELRLDDGGRLLVIGGHGISGSTGNKEIDEYANNDTWFDDASDGSVKARIRFSDGTFADADPAWVFVGPPDFAPLVGNVVSLYDTLWDLAVRVLPLPAGNPIFVDGALGRLSKQKTAWTASGAQSLATYQPRFAAEIYPLLLRAFRARWVFDPGEMDRGPFHVSFLDWNRVADPSAAALPLRRAIFRRLRDPDAKKIEWHQMPAGLGDDYDHLDDNTPRPTGLLSLTRIQYALLKQWSEGRFDAGDWTGVEPGIPAEAAVTPAGLDEAAIENCVGGPFYPGIEVSWLVRVADLYEEPFRFRIDRTPESEITTPPRKIGGLEFRPGFFSQQMALPWQADFYDCHKEEREAPDARIRRYMWWTATRPDDVFPPGKEKQEPWTRRFKPAGVTFGDFEGSNDRFSKMQKKWHTLKFVIKVGDRMEEES